MLFMSAVIPPPPPVISTSRKPYMGALDWRRLVEWLDEDGVISGIEAARTIARCSQVQSAQHPLVRLSSVGMTRVADGKTLDIETITRWLAGRAGLSYLRIDPLKVDVGKVAESMSALYAERHKVLPVKVTPHELVIATAEPFITDWVSEVERQAKRSVRLVVANPLEISKFTAEFFALAKSVKAAAKAGGGAGSASFEQLVELNKSNKQLDANDQGVVKVVDWLWQYAFDQRASDIHLEPRREQGVIRFRIDGVLHPVYQLPMGVHNAMTARIKLLGRMDVVEKRRPQDGRIKTRNPRGDEIEMRLSTLPTAFGEKMVMRIFDPDTTVKNLDALGFSLHDAERWEQLVKRPYGIILVTGPTGSGKTTTLYSTLKRLATEEVNVNTIEDPIEMIEPSFNQTQVQPHLNFDFPEGLRALMRQDPDIIMVGEIRDLQTAEMAVQAALTGHLVFSTLHTNDAPSAVSRLMELGVPSYLINATLLGVLAQRLVRKYCGHCQGAGCEHCGHTGYQGRTGVFELLVTNDAIRAQIHNKTSEADIRTAALASGMQLMRDDGERLIAQGITSREEVLRVTRD